MHLVSSHPPDLRPVLSLKASPPLANGGRPGTLKVIGVGGIVVGILSVIASLLTAGYAAGAFLASNSSRDAVLRNAPVALPVSRADQPVMNAVPLIAETVANGLDAAEREPVVALLQQRLQLSMEQSRQIDALLAEDGREIFGIGSGRSLNPDAALEAIGENFGHLATTAAESAEPVFFETPAGRAEIHVDRAVFYKRHSARIVRVSAGRRVNRSGHPILLPRDVKMLTELAGELAGGAFKQAQMDALRALLADPNQQLVAATETPGGLAIGLNFAVVRADGYADIEFAGGPVLISPEGHVILKGDADAIPGVSRAAGLLVVGEATISIVLAVVLVILAVRLLRRPRQELRPLILWAMVKILVALGGGCTIAWMTWSLMTSLHPIKGDGPAPSRAATVAAGIAVAIVGCAYPLSILIASRVGSVRRYYAPER